MQLLCLNSLVLDKCNFEPTYFSWDFACYSLFIKSAITFFLILLICQVDLITLMTDYQAVP